MLKRVVNNYLHFVNNTGGKYLSVVKYDDNLRIFFRIKIFK